jgi:hypothetical protein
MSFFFRMRFPVSSIIAAVRLFECKSIPLYNGIGHLPGEMGLKSSKAYIRNSLPGIHSGGPFNDSQSHLILEVGDVNRNLLNLIMVKGITPPHPLSPAGERGWGLYLKK